MDFFVAFAIAAASGFWQPSRHNKGWPYQAATGGHK
jgi:hypothetical protein